MATATSFVESTVVNAPLSQIWPVIKLKEFAKFYTAIRKSELVPAAAGERETVRWYFDNGTILTLREEEFSVRLSTTQFLSHGDIHGRTSSLSNTPCHSVSLNASHGASPILAR